MRRTTRHYKGSARGGAPRGRRPSGCLLARGLCQDGEKYVIIRVLYGTCFTQTREVLRCSARCNVGLVAQLVEQRIENPRVGGSIPPQATKLPNPNPYRLGFFLPGTPVLAGGCGFVSRAVGGFSAPFSPSPASLFSVFLYRARERSRG